MAPLPARTGVVIVGTGFAGLAAAHALRRQGVDDVVLLERADAVGGVWRDNTYPGCACDIPSHLYSFSFAPEAGWTRHYAPQAEIRAYLERCVDRLGLRDRIHLRCTVRAARWDEGAARWHVELTDGRTLEAPALVLAIGGLSNPAVPALPGIGRFGGPAFHSARWPAGFDARGQRVAVLGTGASAVQLVPQLQPAAERLYVLQRTPNWVLPRRDHAYRPWQRALLRRVPGLRWLYRQALYWLLESRGVAFVTAPRLMRVVAWQCRRFLARSIPDPALRARLTPGYAPGCKRILLSDDFYPALVQPNVEVLDDTVAEVGERSLTLQSGRVLAVDALVYGTGFAIHDYTGGLQVVGREGRELGATWREAGAAAYLGTTVAGFPNLFVMTGPNTGLGHNSMVVMIEAQARYVAQGVRLLRERGLAALEVRPEVQAAYGAWLHGRDPGTVWKTGCRSWYLDAAGRNVTLWPGYTVGFRLRTAWLRAEDYVLRAAGEAPPDADLPPKAKLPPPVGEGRGEGKRVTA